MIRVGVIRGGPSSEYDVSLNTGANVISHLQGDTLREHYKPIDIFIDREGIWHIRGRQVSMSEVANSVDVVFNALHGDFGEDGKVQQILEQWNIPYTGSGPFPSALGYNKVLAKEQFHKLGIKTPSHILFPAYDGMFDGSLDDYAKKQAKEVLNKMSPPWIVKPVSSGSSMGVHMCKIFDDLVNAFYVSGKESIAVMVEELIEGKEATVGVVEGLRDHELYPLPPIEIRVPKNKDFFDYDAKYSGISEEICPGNFTASEKEELIELASLIHKGLNLSHYSRSDFIIHPKKGIYALEVNTLPGLTNESLVPKALNAVGISVPEFLKHLIDLARKR